MAGVITNPGAVIEDANIKVSGKISDLNKGTNCGYALFRITYQKNGAQPFTHKVYRDCTYKTPASYSFTVPARDPRRAEGLLRAQAQEDRGLRPVPLRRRVEGCLRHDMTR